MFSNIKLFTILSSMTMMLSGCIGPHASFSEGMQDNFLFTSADKVEMNEKKCITLTKPFTLISGAITFSLPQGTYIAKRKNESGYFYYAPTPVVSSNRFLYPSQQGIYLKNKINRGNLFGINSRGYHDRPIRTANLPDDIFPFIKQDTHC